MNLFEGCTATVEKTKSGEWGEGEGGGEWICYSGGTTNNIDLVSYNYTGTCTHIHANTHVHSFTHLFAFLSLICCSVFFCSVNLCYTNTVDFCTFFHGYYFDKTVENILISWFEYLFPSFLQKKQLLGCQIDCSKRSECLYNIKTVAVSSVPYIGYIPMIINRLIRVKWSSCSVCAICTVHGTGWKNQPLEENPKMDRSLMDSDDLTKMEKIPLYKTFREGQRKREKKRNLSYY